jgi:hypothetical protein
MNQITSHDSSTATQMPNEVVGRTAPASLELCLSKSHVWLRYAPRDQRIVNLDTSNVPYDRWTP